MGGERFDPSLLDPNDPFEVEETVLDAWADHGLIFVAAADDLAADWVMIADIGGTVVQVPLAPSPIACRCRPIGVYAATPAQVARYREENS